MPGNRIAIFEGHIGDPDPYLARGRVKKSHRKRSYSSPAQKRQQAKLKHCVKECKRGAGGFRSCMSTCLRKRA